MRVIEDQNGELRITPSAPVYKKGYYKLFCDTCQKEVWHYKPDIGPIRCCVHAGNIIAGNAKPVTNEHYIAQDTKKDLGKDATPQHNAEQNEKVEEKLVDSKGWHKRMCQLCQKYTWWYKSPDEEPIHCTNHSAWTGKKHIVVEKESNHVQVVAQFAPVYNTPSEKELQIANKLDRKLWANAEEKRKSEVVVTDLDWAQDLFPDAEPSGMKDPDKLYCSFCGKETPYTQATSENRPKMRYVQDVYKDASGELHIKEKAVVTSEKVNACPNCSLNIRKPIQVRTV